MMNRRECLQLGAAVAASVGGSAAPSASGAAAAGWPQWGGPNRDFTVPNSARLRASWPAGGPKVLWKRDLGDGYSSVAVDSDVLYTMYHRAETEVTVAADAKTGKTLWEQASPTTFRSAYQDPGNGPYATPLVLKDRIVTAGVTGRIECRARKNGSLLWKQDLWYGHGGTGKSLMALRVADGSIAWSRQDWGNVYSSPMLIEVGGLEQLVQLLDGQVIG